MWDDEPGGPVLLLAGGSGIAPLMSMLRHRAASGSAVPTRLLYSSRSLTDVIYRDELDRLAANGAGLEISLTLTRSQPPGWEGYARRIDDELLAEVAWPSADRPLAFVCGPTTFVEVAAGALTRLGYEPASIKTERFGPTGG